MEKDGFARSLRAESDWAALFSGQPLRSRDHEFLVLFKRYS